jgi:PAS domain S-box-containing protein
MNSEINPNRVEILHVDDEQKFLALTKAYLERKNENFSVNTALSAEEGMELLKSGKYDVVVSDYQMQEWDGLELLQKLRESGYRVPFIMFTGKGREEVAMEALNRGASGYLQKGADIESMLATLAYMIKDVAEKKRAEDKVVKRGKEQQMILNSVPISIFHIDSNSTFVHVNAALAKRFGMTPKDFIGRSTRELFLEDAEDYIKSDKQVLESGDPQIGIIREITTPQGVRWVRVDKVPLKDEDDNVTGIIGFELDITEQKQAKNTLQKSTEEYRSLVESTEDSIYLVDKEYRYLFMNEKHLSRIGLPKNQVIGRTYGEFHSEDKTEKFAEVVKEVFETGKSLQHEHRSHRDNRYFLRTLSPVKEPDGRTRAVTVVSKDITERKQMEEELKVKSAELERFTFMVSHELRSPLATINGFIIMLQEDLEQNNRRKAGNDLEYIKNAATRMDRLLSDTLQLARTGRVVEPPEDVPFGDIVEEALEQTAEQIKASGVEVSVAEDFPTVHVDRMRTVAVLVNLITNSINYMGEQPSPKVAMGLRLDSDNNKTVFFVRDNGIGIGKNEHEKVFELFYRGAKSNKGSGAGLAIAKRIIEAHNGTIWVESEKDKGCMVCFTLPVA